MDIHQFWASVSPACSTPCPLGQKSNEPRQHTQLFQKEGTSCLSRGTIDDGEAKPLGPYGDSVPRRRCCGIGYPFQITDPSLHLLQNWAKEKINLLTKRGNNKPKREISGKWLLPSSCTRRFTDTWVFALSSVFYIHVTVHRDVHVTVHLDVHGTVNRDKFPYNKTN
jgi:hypothetical protein